MKYADTLRADAAKLQEEYDGILDGFERHAETLEAESRTSTPDEVDDLKAKRERAIALKGEIASKLEEAASLDELAAARDAAPKSVNVIRKPDAVDQTDVRSMNPGQARSAALRVVDEVRWLHADQKATVERQISYTNRNHDGDLLARRLLVSESDAYRSAFLKGVTGRADEMTERERAAVSEMRAMSSNDTSGGYGVPVLIDPTIIITTGTGITDILSACRVETITTDTWSGVSAGATSWSFDGEATEVSDDSSTFAQPSVPTYMARGFIPFSIQIGQDYPGLAGELQRLLSVGYQDLLASKLATGSGSEPTGIFTALDANTNVEVVVTSDGVFQAADIDKVWAALPERFRARSSWFMNVDVENEIRAFGSGSATSRFTVDQTAEGISRLNAKKVYLSDYAPTFTGTTGAANILVVGDFSNYLIAQRAGMNLEFIPHLFGTTAGRPTGERGWFAWTRVGADSVNDGAFRLLQNQ